MRCQNARWLGLWSEMVTPATRCSPGPPGNQGNMQEPAPEDEHKTNRLAPDGLLGHDVTFSCHLRDVMAMARNVPGLNRATSGAEPR